MLGYFIPFLSWLLENSYLFFKILIKDHLFSEALPDPF